jgi:hypothetical protein
MTQELDELPDGLLVAGGKRVDGVHKIRSHALKYIGCSSTIW